MRSTSSRAGAIRARAASDTDTGAPSRATATTSATGSGDPSRTTITGSVPGRRASRSTVQPVMGQLSRIVTLSAVAGLAVTACGGSGNALQGKSPQQMVTLASASIDQSSYHMAVHATLKVDASS